MANSSILKAKCNSTELSVKLLISASQPHWFTISTHPSCCNFKIFEFGHIFALVPQFPLFSPVYLISKKFHFKNKQRHFTKISADHLLWSTNSLHIHLNFSSQQSCLLEPGSFISLLLLLASIYISFSSPVQRILLQTLPSSLLPQAIVMPNKPRWLELQHAGAVIPFLRHRCSSGYHAVCFTCKIVP